MHRHLRFYIGIDLHSIPQFLYLLRFPVSIEQRGKQATQIGFQALSQLTDDSSCRSLQLCNCELS